MSIYSRTEQAAALELHNARECAVLVESLQRHLTFLDTVIDRLAASEGTGQAENDTDTDAEVVADILVRLARMDGLEPGKDTSDV